MAEPAPPEKVAVVIAHPDDEVLGCGGTIAKLAARGAAVRVVLPLRRQDPRGVECWDALVAALERSCAVLGAECTLAVPLMDERRAETDPHELHDAIVSHVEWADLVLTHWPGDVNQVHRGVARAVEIATRPFRRRRDVWLFEVPTSTDQAFVQSFSPNTWVALGEEHLARKCEAIALYASEETAGRTPADVERRARVRGAEIGAFAAEPFVTARRFL